mmetsp:Transcript_76913/g.152246  ORF Transcript_76913/g.152246 Transcript_76913/m.152246 type:complete len:395 (-) Transcript_76913:129-1313(-)
MSADHSPEDYGLLLNQCKVFAFCHAYILYPSPARFVSEYVDHGFRGIGHRFRGQSGMIKMMVIEVLFCLAMMFVISAYVHFGLDTNCGVSRVAISKNDTHLTSSEVPQSNIRYLRYHLNCKDEDYLRNQLAIVAGVVSVLSGVIVKRLAILWSQYRTRLPVIGWVGPAVYCRLVSLTKAWQLALRVDGPWPLIFGPDTIYLGLMVTMPLLLLIATYHTYGADNISLVSLSSASKILFGSVCTFLLTYGGLPFIFAPDPEYAVMVEAEMSKDVVLSRIFNGPARTVEWVSTADLEQLWSYADLRTLAETNQYPPTNMGRRVFQKIWNEETCNCGELCSPFDDVAIMLSKIYIPDHNLTVHLFDGTFTKDGKTVWQFQPATSAAAGDGSKSYGSMS